MAYSTDPLTEQAWLRQQIAAFERRLQDLEQSSSASVPAPPQRPVRSTPPPPAPAAPVPAGPLMAPPAPMPPPPGPRSVVAPQGPVRRREPMAMPAAESLLKWAGLVLMFLSALFLVSTAIQRGWIGPELQLAGAGAIGAALIAGGLIIGQSRDGWSVPLTAAGVSVLSATATAGWQWLELGSRKPWIVASFLVLGGAVALTDRLGRPGPAATGIVTTLVSLSFLADSPPEAALLCATAILAVEGASLWQRLTSLHLVTAAAGIVTLGALAFGFSLSGDGSMTAILAAGTIVTLALWAMPMAMTLRTMAPPVSGMSWQPTADRLTISLPVLFATGWALSAELTDAAAGNRFLVVGGLALLGSGLAMVTGRFHASVWVSQLMGGALAVMIGSALVLDGPSLLFGLALQTAALLAFVHIVPDRLATIQAGFMASIAGLLCLGGMLGAIGSDAPAVDDVIHLIVVAMVGGWAWWELRGERSSLAAGLSAAAFVGLVIWPVSALVHIQQGQALISAFWAALGFATLIIGFSRSSIRLTHLSLATLGVVVVKLLTIDLAAVDTFWRVALFFVLGSAFLVASFRLGSAIRRLATTDDAPGPDAGDDAAGGQSSGLAFQK